MFTMDLELFENTVSEAASFSLPISGWFLDTDQRGTE